MYKILTGKEKINSEKLFQKATTTTLRGTVWNYHARKVLN